MRKQKGNLHIHTSFSDGLKKPEEIVEIYKSLGYDFIAFTDHDTLINESYFSDLPDSDDGMIIYKGVELSEPLLCGRHVGVIYGDKEALHVLNHPGLYSMSISDVLEAIEKVSPKYRLDCIDASHYGEYAPFYDTASIPLPKIVTDDAHRDGMFGRAWIEVESEKTKDSILKSIKAGRFSIHFS